MRLGDIQQLLHRVLGKMALVLHLEGIIPRDDIVEMRRALRTVQRDPGVQIDRGVQVPVLPLFQRRSAHAVLVVHVDEFVLVRLAVEPLVVVGVERDGEVVVVVFGQDDEDAFLCVHVAVVGFGDVLALVVGAVLVVFFVQGRADDPAYFVLVFVEEAAHYFPERGVAWPHFGILDVWSVLLEMRGWGIPLAAESGVVDGILVDRTCSLRCVHLEAIVCLLGMCIENLEYSTVRDVEKSWDDKQDLVSRV